MDTLVLESQGRLIFTNQARVIRSNDEVSTDLASATNFEIERSSPYLKWIVGDFVEADKANSNGQFWTAEDLALGEYSIKYSPLNMLHKQTTPVGFFLSTNNIPLSGDAAAQGTAKIEALSGMWSHTFPFEAALVDQADEMGSLFYCVDSETEALTGRGWKKYNEFEPGDEVLALNTVTGVSEWVPVDRMNLYLVKNESLNRMDGLMHSSLTTDGHRWITVRDTVDGPAWEWRKSEEFTYATRIPYAVPHVGAPSLGKYDDEFVELAAWYWTEGTRTCGAVISQSHAVNPQYVARIRGCLQSLYGDPAKVRDGGVWYETRRGRMTSFHLSKSAAEPLFDVAVGDEKIVTPEFLRSLTQAQLGLYIETSIDADGSRAASDGQICITQKSEARIRSFEMACALAGRHTNTTHSSNGWRSCITRRAAGFSPKRLTALGKGFTSTKETYSGVVWCPTSTHGTFLARRRGTVYWTGNSMECRGTHLHCAGTNGCDKTFDYMAVEDHCQHLKERTSVRHIVNPVFRGGALIIPPTRPGWKNATAHVLDDAGVREQAARYAEMTERSYNQVNDAGSDLSASDWEALMAQVVSFGSR